MNDEEGRGWAAEEPATSALNESAAAITALATALPPEALKGFAGDPLEMSAPTCCTANELIARPVADKQLANRY